MADPTGRTVLRRVVEQMRADPRTLEGVVAAARAKSPPVAALPLHEVQRHIAALLGVISSAFIDSSGSGAGLGADVEVADRLAVDRALQGIPLAALLEGFQAGRRYVMLQLVERAKGAELSTDDLVDALYELDSYANEMQNRLIYAYRETELSLARTTHSVRIEALRELLNDGPASHIAEAGLDGGRRYHCLIADLSDPRRAQRIEAVLTATDGLAGMVDGYLCAVTGRLPDPAAVAGILVIAAPAAAPDQLAGCYRLCRAGLVAARRRGLQGLRPLTELALEIASDAYPGLGEMLADVFLARLDPAEEFHRLLAETALVYLSKGGRADLTAAALHVHPNTVKHRLRRFGELTGFDAPGPEEDALGHATRWRWSLHTWLGRRPGR
ncbi:helix-turn-helix domain-containing protein [Actinomadura scrupuli]|uniref:helix-turn-helix domain-containing protein n=1 Tax=Actinomadura scrupuli TaxID=559629 RepID=UPI003D99BDA0